MLDDLSQFKQYKVTELTAKAADLNSVLDLQEHYGFDFENWKLFEGVSTGENGGCRLSELANDKDGFGIDSISGIAAGSVLYKRFKSFVQQFLQKIEHDNSSCFI